MGSIEKVGFIRDMLTRSISEAHGDESLALVRQLLIAVRDECDDRLARADRDEG